MMSSIYNVAGVSYKYQWYNQFNLNTYLTYDCNNFAIDTAIIDQFTPIRMDIDTPSETGDFTFLSKTYCEDTTTECTREVVHNVNLQDSDLDIPT